MSRFDAMILVGKLDALSIVLFAEQRPMAAQACQDAADLIRKEIVKDKEKANVET